MFEIDKEKFGQFIAQLRKEKGLTQKDLAEKLFVSDKAVSKWETGMHLPDITVLTPLADILGVSVTELLQGKRLESETVEKDAVDELLRQALAMNEKEQANRLRNRKGAIAAFIASVIWGFFQLQMLSVIGYTFDQMSMLLLFLILAACFGTYFVFLSEDRIPAFYDENKINFYSHGPLRMNMPGMRFNNSNWPHIVRFIRGWSCGSLLSAPMVFYILERLLSDIWLPVVLILLLFVSLLVPLYAVGKKYE